MGVVHRVNAVRASCLEICLVGCGRVGIAAGGSIVIADSLINVGRHVHEMARCRHQLWQLRRVSERAFRTLRRFDGMNVIVDRAGVIGITTQHRLKCRHDLFSTFGRFAVRAPELPGTQVHRALRVKRRRVEVVRITLDQFAHRVFVIDGELFQICFRFDGIALPERFDVGAFVLGSFGCERKRFLHRFVSSFFSVGSDVEIDVWAQRERNAPISHGEIGINFSRALEGTNRFVVIKRVDESKALIEKLLCFGFGCRDRVVMRAHAGDQFGRLFAFHLHVRVLSADNGGEENSQRDSYTMLHFQKSPTVANFQ